MSHFAFPHLTIPVQAAAKINVIGGEGDDALVINIQNGAIPVALGISFDGGNDVTGDTLTLTGGTLTQYPSGAQEYRFVDSNGIEQSVFRNSTVEFVDLTGLEAPNLNETNALLSMSGGFEFLSSKLADPFASLEMPVLGKSLGDVLSGRLISDLSPPSLPGLGFNSPQVLQGVGDVSEQFLRRIFEDASTGDFSFATIGDTISSLEELAAALDAIDNFDPNGAPITANLNNTTYDPISGLFNLQLNKTLRGAAQLELDLLDGAINIDGAIELQADVLLNLEFGVDAAGFFINWQSYTPELVIKNIQVSGDIDASGAFGFLGVTLSNPTLTVDPDVEIQMDLVNTLEGTSTLRPLDLSSGQLDDVLIIDIQENPLSSSPPSIIFSFDASASAFLGDGNPAVELLDAPVTLAWADIQNVDDVAITYESSVAENSPEVSQHVGRRRCSST